MTNIRVGIHKISIASLDVTELAIHLNRVPHKSITKLVVHSIVLLNEKKIIFNTRGGNAWFLAKTFCDYYYSDKKNSTRFLGKIENELKNLFIDILVNTYMREKGTKWLSEGISGIHFYLVQIDTQSSNIVKHTQFFL